LQHSPGLCLRFQFALNIPKDTIWSLQDPCTMGCKRCPSPSAYEANNLLTLTITICFSLYSSRHVTFMCICFTLINAEIGPPFSFGGRWRLLRAGLREENE
jgi:hypothetical protein